MNFVVQVSKSAKKELSRLDKKAQLRIVDELRILEGNPNNGSGKNLKALDGYRIRVGDYRIIYTINKDSKTITVYRIRHRSKAYRT